MQEMRKLLAAAPEDECLISRFFLGSGAREREVATACWRNIDFSGGTFKVQAKPEYGFVPKDHEERLVPLPDDLLALLAQRKAARLKSPLLFPNDVGLPQTHLLRRLQR